MSAESYTGYLTNMNTVLRAASRMGQPYRQRVHGRPQLQVESLSPLVYREYGRVFNRAPHIAGSFAVVGFIAQQLEINGQDTDLYRTFGVIEAEHGLQYGVLAHTDVVLGAARHVAVFAREQGLLPDSPASH